MSHGTLALASNCQTVGLENCFNLLNADFSIEGIDIWEYKKKIEFYNANMSQYFRTIVHPEFQAIPGYDPSAAIHINYLPAVYFDGYHPDICYVQADGQAVNGPVHAYHSLIALAAYRSGFSVAETLRLYNGHIYEVCGYFDAWAPARDVMIAEFNRFNIDIREDFARWGRDQAFMYSVNHPHIRVIHDIARRFMLSHGVPVFEGDFRPSDNLANGACFPVFPEIGESLGVAGSYLFKPIGQWRYLTLEQFVRGSFEHFAPYGREHLIAGGYEGRYARVEAAIRGEI